MQPTICQYLEDETLDLIFRSSIKIEDLKTDNSGEAYYLQDSGNDRHITSDEMKLFKSYLHHGIDLNRYNVSSNILSKDYIKIKDIELPIDYFDAVNRVEENPNSYKNGEYYYNFDECKDYFITQCDDLYFMSLLINSAMDKGYRLLFRDIQYRIVEMSKAKVLSF